MLFCWCLVIVRGYRIYVLSIGVSFNFTWFWVIQFMFNGPPIAMVIWRWEPAVFILGSMIAGFTLFFSRSRTNSDLIWDIPTSKIHERNAWNLCWSFECCKCHYFNENEAIFLCISWKHRPWKRFCFKWQIKFIIGKGSTLRMSKILTMSDVRNGFIDWLHGYKLWAFMLPTWTVKMTDTHKFSFC